MLEKVSFTFAKYFSKMNLGDNRNIESKNAVTKACEDALRNRQFIKYSSQILLPSEFLELSGKVYINPEDIKFVDPYTVMNNGKIKLYELLAKQMLFQKKYEDYLTGKIK